jgi:predicted membrane-bound spermidine synthase
VITLFMLGLAAGSGIRKRPTHMSLTTEMLGLQILLSLLSVFIPVLLILLSRPGTPDLLLLVSVALMVLMVSFLVGREYRTASLMDRDHPAKTGSGNYAAELAGSAFGALIVTIYLIPVAGFLTTGIVLAVVNLFTATLLLLKGKNRLSLYNR